VPYIREDKVKIQRFLRFLPQSYKDKIEFDNPKTLSEVFRKAKMCYDQYKQWSELPKAWKDKKHDIMNQRRRAINQPLSGMQQRISQGNIFTPITRTPKGEVDQLIWEPRSLGTAPGNR
jgi:hypothetical protein